MLNIMIEDNGHFIIDNEKHMDLFFKRLQILSTVLPD